MNEISMWRQETLNCALIPAGLTTSKQGQSRGILESVRCANNNVKICGLSKPLWNIEQLFVLNE